MSGSRTPVDALAMLFVPGNDERKAAKAVELGISAVILDLEDSIPAHLKDEARQAVARTLSSWTAAASAAFVRVNGSDSAHHDADIQAVVGPKLCGILVSKAETAEQIERLDGQLSTLEAAHGLKVGTTLLLPTIESAQGLANAQQIAQASARVHSLTLGAADFARDLGLPENDSTVRSPLLERARIDLVLASRLAGIAPPHDGSYTRFQDDVGLKQEVASARALGMLGKHAIHPRQVPLISAGFAPTEAEVAVAQAIVSGFDLAVAAGQATVVVEGQFVDQPVYDRAAQLLALIPAGGQ